MPIGSLYTHMRSEELINLRHAFLMDRERTREQTTIDFIDHRVGIIERILEIRGVYVQ